MFKFTSWLKNNSEQKRDPKEEQKQQEDDKASLKSPQTLVETILKDNVHSKPQETFPDPIKHGTATWSTLLFSNLTPTNSLTADVATCKPGAFLSRSP